MGVEGRKRERRDTCSGLVLSKPRLRNFFVRGRESEQQKNGEPFRAAVQGFRCYLSICARSVWYDLAVFHSLDM